MKLLSLTVAIVILLIKPETSFSFDISRLYPDETSGIDDQPGRGRTLSSRLYDDFELDSGGRIEKTTLNPVSNMLSSDRGVSEVAISDDRVHQIVGNPDKILNTSYSFSDITANLNDRCGPSLLTAVEVEKLVGRTAQSYGVDPSLAKAIAWTESRFDQNRNSDRGARGAMQLMPGTARELAVSDICDPVANIDGGVRHLKRLLEEFKNPFLAIAAYNAGSQAVYDNEGVPPFQETVRYVAAVINYQLGMTVPQKSFARETIPTDAASPSGDIASDVIGAGASRFVKGVMHF